MAFCMLQGCACGCKSCQVIRNIEFAFGMQSLHFVQCSVALSVLGNCREWRGLALALATPAQLTGFQVNPNLGSHTFAFNQVCSLVLYGCLGLAWFPTHWW